MAIRGMKMMKKMATAFMALCLTVSGITMSTYAADGKIMFTDPSAEVGETLSVRGVLAADSDIEDRRIVMSYDESKLKFKDGDNVTETAPGQLTYDVTGEQSGTRVEFMMYFDVLEEGTTKIEVDSYTAWTTESERIYCEGNEGFSTIVITEGEVVDEPVENEPTDNPSQETPSTETPGTVDTDNSNKQDKNFVKTFLGKVATRLENYLEYVILGVLCVFAFLMLMIIILAVKLRNRNEELDELYDIYGIDLDHDELKKKGKKHNSADKKVLVDKKITEETKSSEETSSIEDSDDFGNAEDEALETSKNDLIDEEMIDEEVLMQLDEEDNFEVEEEIELQDDINFVKGMHSMDMSRILAKAAGDDLQPSDDDDDIKFKKAQKKNDEEELLEEEEFFDDGEEDIDYEFDFIDLDD